MRIGFYSTAGDGWTFGEVSAPNMPYCPACHAFHYSNNQCLSDDERRNLANAARDKLLEMQAEGRLSVEYIFRDAFNCPGMGLLKGWKDKFEDLISIL